jgi:hypothetical protein
VLLVLWLLAQLNPALPFFGAGNIITEEIGQRFHAELLLVIAVGLSICGFALFVSVLMRSTTGALRVTLVLLTIALWLKFAASSVMLKPHFSAEWVSSGRVIGLAVGLAVFFPMRKMGRLTRIYLAIVFVLAGALFAKIFGSYDAINEVLRFFNWPHGQLAGLRHAHRLPARALALRRARLPHRVLLPHTQGEHAARAHADARVARVLIRLATRRTNGPQWGATSGSRRSVSRRTTS